MCLNERQCEGLEEDLIRLRGRLPVSMVGNEVDVRGRGDYPKVSTPSHHVVSRLTGCGRTLPVRDLNRRTERQEE